MVLLSFSIPVCQFCLSVCLSVCLSICLFVCLPVSISVCLRACLLVCLHFCLPDVWPSTHEPMAPTLQARENSSNSSCVYWERNIDSGYGGWSERGCRVAMVDEQTVVCTCNHMSSFALVVVSFLETDCLSLCIQGICVPPTLSSEYH